MQPDKLAQIREALAKLEKAEPLAVQGPHYGGYHQAAAVLDYFEPTVLKPFDPDAADRDLATINSEPLTVDGRPYWRLNDDVRRATLKQLGSREALKQALAANWPRPATVLQRQLEAYIAGTAPPLAQQSREELTATFQITDWLDGLVEGLPAREAVRQWYDRHNLYQPFEQLAGAAFSGRETELATLERFLVSDQDTFAPLNVFGLGGMGKSTLIARFILNHRDALAWVYIDFDRPTIHARRPLTLLIEGLGQIGVQFPEVRDRCEKLQRVWRDELQQVQQFAAQKSAPTRRDLRDYAASFSELIYSLGRPAPRVLFVLDTFEQVQRRGAIAVDEVLRLMGDLFKEGQAASRGVHVRTIISGRAPLKSSLVNPDPVIELGDFKPDAARTFLHNLKVPADVASFVVRNVGGSPLSLHLAARWWEKKGRPADVETLFGGLAELAYEERQGVLFARLLGTIDNEDVKKLAFPGLVLRRITTELIRKVLAKPCEVEVSNQAQAEALYEMLRQEVTLLDDEGDALRHRQDVRAVMIRLMREQDPHKHRQIQELAVSYYAQRDDPVSRAEEIYHRLLLEQPLDVLDQRWGDGSNIAVESLLDARDELPPRQRAWLAANVKGMSLTDEERDQARLADWEYDTEQQVKELLALGRAEEALERLQQRSERSPGSVLYGLEAETFEALGDLTGALAAVERGLDESKQAGQFGTATDLAIRQAALARALGDLQKARQALDQAQEWADLRDSGPLYQLRIGLERLPLQNGPDDALAAALAGWFTRLDDQTIIEQPVLMGRLAGAVGAEHDAVLWRVLALTGLEGEERGRLRRLGRTVARWDRAYSQEHDLAAGAILKRLQIEEQGDDLEASWSTFWLNASATTRVSVLDQLRQFEPRLSPDIRQDLADILAARQRPGVEQDEPAPSSTGDPQPPVVVSGSASTKGGRIPRDVTLTPSQRSKLRQIIVEAFTVDELREILLFRLEIDLESIGGPGQSLQRLSHETIEYARRTVRVGALLQALREARPSRADLYQLVQEVTGEATSDTTLEKVIEQGSVLDLSQFRELLARVEFQIGTIALTGQQRATGFLVGPDVVLTVYHAVEEVIRGEAPPSAVQFRFEQSGETFPLQNKEWLIDASPYSQNDTDPFGKPAPDELDFALLRVQGEPGYAPVGGADLESVGYARGWISVPDDPPSLQPGRQILIAYYGAAGSLKLTLGRIKGNNENASRLRYEAKTEPGAAGAPCFDGDFKLMAVHQASYSGLQDDFRQGIPIAAIQRFLKDRGTWSPS